MSLCAFQHPFLVQILRNRLVSKEHEHIDMTLSGVMPSAVSGMYVCSLLYVARIPLPVRQQAIVE